MTELELLAAHACCTSNRKSLSSSDQAGCFYCKATFRPQEVLDWVDDKGGDTALCPKCGIDSVLGDASGLPVTDAQFLAAMHRRWFEQTVTL